jgi:sporulation protein YabP
MENSLGSNIKLTNRSSCEVDGVKKLISFEPSEFVLQTNLGSLLIKGKGLSLGEMNTEGGKLTLSGDIISLSYVNKVNNQKESIIKKLFK